MKKRCRKSLLESLRQKLSCNKNSIKAEEFELFVELLKADEFQSVFEKQIKLTEKQIGQMEKGKWLQL